MMTPQRLHVGPLPEFQEGGDIVHTVITEEMDEIEAILIGLILGDGSLTPPSIRRLESQLHLGYSEKYLPYLVWLQQKLGPIGAKPIQPKRGYRQYHFYTVPTKGIGRLRQLFYPNGIKCIPSQMYQLLVHPLSLAVWYMDDGTLDYRAGSHRNASIATYNFSENDCLELRDVLEKNFGLIANIHRSTMRGKVYYRLYFPSASMDRFLTLIEPYIQPCFAYKTLKVGQQLR